MSTKITLLCSTLLEFLLVAPKLLLPRLRALPLLPVSPCYPGISAVGLFHSGLTALPLGFTTNPCPFQHVPADTHCPSTGQYGARHLEPALTTADRCAQLLFLALPHIKGLHPPPTLWMVQWDDLYTTASLGIGLVLTPQN